MARIQPIPRLPREIEVAASSGITASYSSRLRLVVGVTSVCLFAAVYVWFAFALYRSSRLSSRADPAELRKAIAWQYRDAELHDLLGQSLLWKSQDARAAVAQFETATRLNAYSSAYWLHLAQAYATTGDESRQAAAIAHALKVDPTTPEIAWHAANLALLQGKTSEALRQLAVVIRYDPATADAALNLSWRASGNLDEIERNLPKDSATYLKLLRVLVDHEQWSDAATVWSSLMQIRPMSDPAAAMFYVDALIDKRDIPSAKSAWDQLVRESSALRSYVHERNLVVDGAFEHDILNSGFDWRYRKSPNATIQVDTAQSHQGTQSVLVTYSGPNGDAGLYQLVPVTSGVSFTASAWAKSEELQTANGPRLTISDPYSNTEYAHSDETVGTTSWHPLRAQFTPPDGVRLVVVRFSRVPDLTRIQGKFWIDTVRLFKSDGETEE